ncbi:hypothetical protein Sden_0807 [Shewanella denitrificans OS217]|jgi:hypothetical protein|uniref:Uncharacterized protein n=1 Tax=Shewanella denitrificans (strain OS217 / ATCC BAA-1090 / DSM 15013) TaxID=318161 RepID=Q12R29_SHEDO|nr:hypothetical protein [Shewanella denitrificans]ABE54097.1 hypothetical protein Sden_0807 [Shewanella denitrificans OS217]
MNSTIQFLANLASDAALQAADAVNRAELPAHINAMIQANDIKALKAELDVVPDIVCILVVADEDDDEQVDQLQDDSPAPLKIAANG